MGTGITGDGDVVDQSVDPDVDGLVGVARDRDSPLDARGRARDGQLGSVANLLEDVGAILGRGDG